MKMREPETDEFAEWYRLIPVDAVTSRVTAKGFEARCLKAALAAAKTEQEKAAALLFARDSGVKKVEYMSLHGKPCCSQCCSIICKGDCDFSYLISTNSDSGEIPLLTRADFFNQAGELREISYDTQTPLLMGYHHEDLEPLLATGPKGFVYGEIVVLDS